MGLYGHLPTFGISLKWPLKELHLTSGIFFLGEILNTATKFDFTQCFEKTIKAVNGYSSSGSNFVFSSSLIYIIRKMSDR